ncbi:MAG: type IV pilus assembly protein FimV, partial [Gammaproteobacteria bacterium]
MRIRLACAAGLLLYVPITVLALGLGPMQTNSSLNEPFDAKIPLVAAKVEQLDTLKVGLANRAQFKRAGLDYALTLSDLRFELVQPKTGSDYVRIWSKEPVREPVLDFLLEVNWSSGRLIREFTVLLDPPRYEATSSVAPHRSAATASPRVRPTYSSPVADMNPGATSDQYGPTRAGDSLWNIAQGARSGKVSVQQMMLALLQANPDAFINANINHLKQGQILRIPEAGARPANTQADALAE